MTWFPAQHHDSFLIPQYTPLPPCFPSNEVHRSPLNSTALQYPEQSCPSSLASSLCVCAQPHLTLCDPMDCSPPDSSVREIFLARILEWVAVPSFRGSSWSRHQTHLSCISCIGRWAARVALVVKNLPANSGERRDAGSIPGSGRSPWGVHGNHYSNIPVWRITWTKEPGRLQSRGRKESEMTEAT